MFPIAWRVPSFLGLLAHLVVQLFYMIGSKITWSLRGSGFLCEVK